MRPTQMFVKWQGIIISTEDFGAIFKENIELELSCTGTDDDKVAPPAKATPPPPAKARPSASSHTWTDPNAHTVVHDVDAKKIEARGPRPPTFSASDGKPSILKSKRSSSADTDPGHASVDIHGSNAYSTRISTCHDPSTLVTRLLESTRHDATVKTRRSSDNTQRSSSVGCTSIQRMRRRVKIRSQSKIAKKKQAPRPLKRKHE